MGPSVSNFFSEAMFIEVKSGDCHLVSLFRFRRVVFLLFDDQVTRPNLNLQGSDDALSCYSLPVAGRGRGDAN